MIRVVQNFTGYPDGKRRRFSVGDSPSDLTADYEALLIAKGHASRPVPAPSDGIEAVAEIKTRSPRRARAGS